LEGNPSLEEVVQEGGCGEVETGRHQADRKLLWFLPAIYPTQQQQKMEQYHDEVIAWEYEWDTRDEAEHLDKIKPT